MSYYIGLSVLSNKEAERRERQKLLSAEARRVLSRLAGRPLTGDDIAAGGQGRPFFPDCGADFSISHSGALAAVSMVSGKNLHTGCDVELVGKRTRLKEITEDFFSVPEMEYIFSGEHPHCECLNEARFYEIWTLKECYIKLRGLSVFDMAKVPSFICEGNFSFNAAAASPLAFHLYELYGADERYMLAAAIEGAWHEQFEIRWFSQVSLSCKSVAKINAPLIPAETVSPKM